MFGADPRDERRICLLTLEGSLDGDDLVNLAHRLRGLGAQGVFRVVVDLSRIDHWDFRGLRCLAEAVESRKARGSVTAFIIPSRYLREIAVAAGVLEQFDVYDSLCLEDWDGVNPPREGEMSSGQPSVRRASGL